jgi:MFS family permease
MNNAPRRNPNNRFPLAALLTANAISQTGNLLSYLAIPWFVLETTGSASQTGITVAVRVLPMAVAGIVGGAIVDRVGYKRMSVVSDVASGVATAAIPLLHVTVGLSFWQLLALVFVGAALVMPGNTARRSLYPDLAEAGGVSAERANVAYQVVLRSAGLVGPPLAGILIAVIGSGNLLWLDAVSFLISAAIVVAAVPSERAVARSARETGARRYVADVLDGFRFIRRDPIILALTLTLFLGAFLAEPIYSAILPVYVNDVYGSAVDLGLIFAALAAGSLAGNALFLTLGPRLPRRGLVIGGFAVRALAFWVLVFMPPPVVVAAVIGVAAVCLEPVNPLSMTILQEQVPAGMRGRVFGAIAAVGAGTSLGMVIYGYLIEAIGLQATLFVLATVNLGLPLSMLMLPGYRLLGKPRPPPAASSALAGTSSRTT